MLHNTISLYLTGIHLHQPKYANVLRQTDSVYPFSLGSRWLWHLFMINLYAFNICDTLKHNGFVIDFIDFIYVLSPIYVCKI